MRRAYSSSMTRLLERYRISLKRIVFIYECLLEIEGIEIRRGEIVSELAAAAARARSARSDCNGRERRTAVCPNLSANCGVGIGWRSRCCRSSHSSVWPAGEAERLDLKRFSRYWQPLKRRALSLNRSFDELI
jgi:hypothetical protein